MTKIESYINQDRLLNNRRYLHAHPELSFQEEKTANYIQNQLAKYPALTIIRPTKTSVVAVLDSKKPGKTIALRADMDALPIQEAVDLPFASTSQNVMHACGHDAHTAMLLETVEVFMTNFADQITGKVKFIFQHAEELFPGGAVDIVKAGILDDVDQIFGLHVNSTAPVGHLDYHDGPATAASDKYQITIQGKGTHAAEPEKGIDPIIIGAQIVNALQTIVSRQLPANDATVVSNTRFVAKAGEAINIVPDTAQLAGSVRTINPASRQLVADQIKRTSESIASIYGGSVDIDYTFGYASIINDSDATKMLASSANKSLGTALVSEIPTMMVSEDFSAYTQKIKGSFAMIGAAMTDPALVFPHHHPKFQINEDVLPLGVLFELGLIIDELGTDDLKQALNR